MSREFNEFVSTHRDREDLTSINIVILSRRAYCTTNIVSQFQSLIIAPNPTMAEDSETFKLSFKQSPSMGQLYI